MKRAAYFEVEPGRLMTARDLKTLLETCPDHAMICGADGPFTSVRSEPGANEPFVLLSYQAQPEAR